MEDTKCFFVSLVALYSKRLLNGYMCDMDKLWRDIVSFRRLIRLEQAITNCQLKGKIIDEINKLKRRLAQTYSLPCNNC